MYKNYSKKIVVFFVIVLFIILLFTPNIDADNLNSRKITKNDGNINSNAVLIEEFPVNLEFKIPIGGIKALDNHIDPGSKPDFKIYITLPEDIMCEGEDNSISHSFGDNENQVPDDEPWIANFIIDAWKVGRNSKTGWIDFKLVDKEFGGAWEEDLLEWSTDYPLTNSGIDSPHSNEHVKIMVKIKDDAPSHVGGKIIEPGPGERTIEEGETIKFRAKGSGGVPFPPSSGKEYNYKWKIEYPEGQWTGWFKSQNPSQTYKKAGLSYGVRLLVRDYFGWGVIGENDFITIKVEEEESINKREKLDKVLLIENIRVLLEKWKLPIINKLCLTNLLI